MRPDAAAAVVVVVVVVGVAVAAGDAAAVSERRKCCSQVPSSFGILLNSLENVQMTARGCALLPSCSRALVLTCTTQFASVQQYHLPIHRYYNVSLFPIHLQSSFERRAGVPSACDGVTGCHRYPLAPLQLAVCSLSSLLLLLLLLLLLQPWDCTSLPRHHPQELLREMADPMVSRVCDGTSAKLSLACSGRFKASPSPDSDTAFRGLQKQPSSEAPLVLPAFETHRFSHDNIRFALKLRVSLIPTYFPPVPSDIWNCRTLSP
jgi:hypothetical protein